ncbi:hypothetical protein H311_00439, partial [Anncaliia algerae PRA109]
MFLKFKLIYVFVLKKSLFISCAEQNPNSQISFVDNEGTNFKECQVGEILGNEPSKRKRVSSQATNDTLTRKNQDSKISVDTKKSLKEVILNKLGNLLNDNTNTFASNITVLKKFNLLKGVKCFDEYINANIENLLDKNKESIKNALLILYPCILENDLPDQATVIQMINNETIILFLTYLDSKIIEFINSNEYISNDETLFLIYSNIKDISKNQIISNQSYKNFI